MQYTFHSLRNNLLIAMPKLNDSYFNKAVILLCEHDEHGAMGIVINRPMDVSIADIIEEMKIPHSDKELKKHPVQSGGPVNTERGLIIYCSSDDDTDHPEAISHNWNTSTKVSDDLTVVASNDIIHAIARNELDNPYIMALGYCQWQAGQLEQEIKDNAWLTLPVDLDIMFYAPYDQQWRECTYNLGIEDLCNLSSYSGHA